MAKRNGKPKANGKREAMLTLELLDPLKFQTLEDVRRFVEGDAFPMMAYAIGRVACPSVELADGQLGELGNQARLAAYYVARDLAAIAKAASRGKPVRGVVEDCGAFDAEGREKHRRALLFVALSSGDNGVPTEHTRRAVLAQLAPREVAR